MVHIGKVMNPFTVPTKVIIIFQSHYSFVPSVLQLVGLRFYVTLIIIITTFESPLLKYQIDRKVINVKNYMFKHPIIIQLYLT